MYLWPTVWLRRGCCGACRGFLTVQGERGGAGGRAGAVGGHAAVLALVLGINPGDLQLAAVVKLGHPEELGLLDLLLLVEPADLHI